MAQSTELEEYKLSMWCYTARKQVVAYAKPAHRQSKRVANIVEVTDCAMFDIQRAKTFNCPYYRDSICLIGKIREGRWELGYVKKVKP